MLDSVHWPAFLKLCGGELWHVSDRDPSQIKSAGLLPPTRGSTWTPALAPRPAHVYFTCPRKPSSALGRWLVVVDATGLDPEKFDIDEDNYFCTLEPGSPLRGRYQPVFEVDEVPPAVRARLEDAEFSAATSASPSAGEWVNQVAACSGLDSPGQVIMSLEERSVSYKDIVPPRLIKCVVDKLDLNWRTYRPPP
ncbi:MAG TPA: hypothetical protein VFC57_09430 [Aeromicrobium sp.]|nr:hypothetical protein [Aeromicrobium sp.]